MRTLTLVVSCLLSPAVLALDYPQTNAPQELAYIARYKQDLPRLTSPDLFAFPASTPAWPCAVPETEQYKLAGLQMAHPELRKDIEKQTRKLLRAQGMSADSAPVTTYSNVRIVPLKAQCTAGKLSGELVLLAAYESLMEMKITSKDGTQISRTRSQVLTRSEQRADAPNAGSVMFIRNTSSSQTSHDNPDMEAMNKKLGLNASGPSTSLTVNYLGAYGSLASFTEMNLNIPGAAAGPQLHSSFMLNTNEHQGRMTNYTGKQLLMTVPTRDGLAHGEQLVYMDNFAKKSKLSLDKLPGMENAREVTINGVDLIEQRTCLQEGAPVKITPCPAN